MVVLYKGILYCIEGTCVFYQMAMNLGTDKEVAQKGVVNVVYIHT